MFVLKQHDNLSVGEFHRSRGGTKEALRRNSSSWQSGWVIITDCPGRRAISLCLGYHGFGYRFGNQPVWRLPNQNDPKWLSIFQGTRFVYCREVLWPVYLCIVRGWLALVSRLMWLIVFRLRWEMWLPDMFADCILNHIQTDRMSWWFDNLWQPFDNLLTTFPRIPSKCPRNKVFEARIEHVFKSHPFPTLTSIATFQKFLYLICLGKL